eukprot:3731193-Rhodomonas_salina.1
MIGSKPARRTQPENFQVQGTGTRSTQCDAAARRTRRPMIISGPGTKSVEEAASHDSQTPSHGCYTGRPGRSTGKVGVRHHLHIQL